MSIEEQIAKLIARYQSLDVRQLKRFNEENTKKDFILPLFKHLGWDVTNSDEVAAEEKSSNGRVDYAFKVGGVSKFYLEAKPLREDLNQRPDWAKQVITYAENKGVTWAVLTNFKQLMVFNAEWDKPTLERARFLNLTYQEYLPAFHKLWWLSRDSVEKGILDEEARQVGALKPKLPVEKSLLDQLLRWRGELFNQIYQHNRDKGLDLYQVDELIQQFINRLIFIRSTEDRGIEENRLRAALHQWRDSERKGELVERMRAIFHEFATLYDSDLFPLLDTWDSLIVESDTIEKIIEGSYERPTRLAGYDFAAIDADVLGAVYEQYLGYVAQVAREEAKKRATQARLLGFEAPAFELEARRIKRKQQGIYYTPKFVTDYIVKETVGRFIKEHSHNDIFNIKILDPACGSGSFLIRAYDELLHYHARQKGKSPAELDHWERLSILNRNIFGVDLDRQAVEITRLSLLLCSLTKREILPSLADNIRQGNSLISGREEELRHYFGDDWEEKKPFNWKGKFPDIMKDGGFDVVIGNPPYALLQPQNVSDGELRFIHDHYLCAQYKVDTFHLFLERGISLLAEKGKLGFIVPNTFLMNIYTSNLRKLILDTCRILEIVIIPRQVFPEAEVDNTILILQKESDASKRNDNEIRYKITADDVQLSAIFPSLRSEGTVKQQAFSTQQNYVFNISLGSTLNSTLTKADEKSLVLGELARVHFGLQTRDRRRYPDDVIVTSDRRRIGAPYQPCLTGKDIERYAICFGNRYVYFDESIRAGGCWDKEMHFADEKIIIRQIGEYPIAAFDEKGNCCLNTVFMVKLRTAYLDLRYVLGIINSQFIRGYWRGRFSDQKVLFPKIKGAHLKQLPIRSIDFNNSAEKKMHDDLVTLVERMLELNRRLAPIRNTSFGERDELLREIKRTDAEIDQKVYELYGLTEEEKQVIQTSLASKS